MSLRSSFEKQKAGILERLRTQFGDGTGMLAFMLLQLSLSGQPCDITFHDRLPILDVEIDPKISIPLLYGAGGRVLQDRLETILLSNLEVVSFSQIWMIHPMPVGGIPPGELTSVNLDEGKKKCGPNGETLREMIRDVYHCKSVEEEDRFLRRFLAS